MLHLQKEEGHGWDKDRDRGTAAREELIKAPTTTTTKKIHVAPEFLAEISIHRNSRYYHALQLFKKVGLIILWM